VVAFPQFDSFLEDRIPCRLGPCKILFLKLFSIRLLMVHTWNSLLNDVLLDLLLTALLAAWEEASISKVLRLVLRLWMQNGLGRWAFELVGEGLELIACVWLVNVHLPFIWELPNLLYLLIRENLFSSWCYVLDGVHSNLRADGIPFTLSSITTLLLQKQSRNRLLLGLHHLLIARNFWSPLNLISFIVPLISLVFLIWFLDGALVHHRAFDTMQIEFIVIRCGWYLRIAKIFKSKFALLIGKILS